MKASNWKYRVVRHTRGGSIHEVTDLCVFASYRLTHGIVSINAIKNSQGDRPNIHLEIDGLTIDDLQKMKQQIEDCLTELKNKQHEV